MGLRWRILSAMKEAARLLVNPGSGSADTAPLLRVAAERREGVRYHESQDAEDMRTQVRDAVAEGVPRLVVAGGDGTIHLAVNMLMRARAAEGLAANALPVLGIIPLGTANDLAKSLALPMPPDKALEIALGEATRVIDVLQIAHDAAGSNDEYSAGDPQSCYAINAITGGLSVRVHEELDDSIKQWWGGFAYARAMFEVLGDAPDHAVEIETDRDAWRGNAFGLVIANGPRAGGQTIMPGAVPDDGLAEAALVCAEGKAERLKLLAEFAAGTHLDSPRVRWAPAKRVRIHATPQMPLIADGERCGETPVRVTVMPAAMRVAVPGGAGAAG